MLFSAILTVVVVAAVIQFGTSWLFIAIGNYLFGVLAGHYCASQVRRYDQANRSVIRRNAGHGTASGGSDTLESWIIGINKLAPVIPIIPVVTLCVALYCRRKARYVEAHGSVQCQVEGNRVPVLPRGFQNRGVSF